MKILLIGGDSYIGGAFYNNSSFKNSISVISRKKTTILNEILIKDLFSIPDSFFKNIDYVLSFIGIAHKTEKIDEDLYFKINRDLVQKLAIQSKKNNVKHFLQMSSISVYGDCDYIDENIEENPTCIYGQSKLEADELLLKLVDNTFSISLLRPPMIYGYNAPGNWDRLVRLVDKSFFLPFKDMKNNRTFLYINNFVIYLDCIIKNNLLGILIITDDFDLSTEDLIKMIIEMKGNKRILFNFRLFFLLKFMFPKIYKKIYGDLVVKKNIKSPILLDRKSISKELKVIGSKI